MDDLHIVAEIGQVIAGGKDGRQSDDDVTIYKSLGIIAQDLAAATYVLRSAEEKDLGHVIAM